MRIFSLSAALKFIALLSIAALIGCESADVDPEHIAASGGGTSGGSSDGTLPGPGGESIKPINVDPATDVTTLINDITILKVTPISGYTFTWELSNTSLGNINKPTGDRILYTTKFIPPTESETQTITATGRNPSDTTVIYRGTSKITHRAP